NLLDPDYRRVPEPEHDVSLIEGTAQDQNAVDAFPIAKLLDGQLGDAFPGPNLHVKVGAERLVAMDPFLRQDDGASSCGNHRGQKIYNAPGQHRAHEMRIRWHTGVL